MLNTKYIAYIFFSLELTRPLVCPRSKRFAYYRKLRAKNVGRQRRLTEFFAIRFSEKNSRNRFFEGKKEEKEGKENVDQRTRVDTTEKKCRGRGRWNEARGRMDSFLSHSSWHHLVTQCQDSNRVT